MSDLLPKSVSKICNLKIFPKIYFGFVTRAAGTVEQLPKAVTLANELKNEWQQKQGVCAITRALQSGDELALG